MLLDALKRVATCRMSFERAKIIGRRNTFLDGLFAIAFNRDLELMDMLLRLALYLVLNISWAMFFMFWIFLLGLPTFIWTFGASWVCFHLLCMLPCTCFRRQSTVESRQTVLRDNVRVAVSVQQPVRKRSKQRAVVCALQPSTPWVPTFADGSEAARLLPPTQYNLNFVAVQLPDRML